MSQNLYEYARLLGKMGDHPRQQRRLFIGAMRTAGHNQDQAQWLYEEVVQAAYRSLAPNGQYISAIIERVIYMAARGDTYEDTIAWIQALPRELWYQSTAEAFIPDLFPGGPGRLFTDE